MAFAGAFHQHLARRVDGPCRDAERRQRARRQGCRAILPAFSAEVGAERIIGWVQEDNRAVLAMSRRVGFEIDGQLPRGAGRLVRLEALNGCSSSNRRRSCPASAAKKAAKAQTSAASKDIAFQKETRDLIRSDLGRLSRGWRSGAAGA